MQSYLGYSPQLFDFTQHLLPFVLLVLWDGRVLSQYFQQLRIVLAAHLLVEAMEGRQRTEELRTLQLIKLVTKLVCGSVVEVGQLQLSHCVSQEYLHH